MYYFLTQFSYFVHLIALSPYLYSYTLLLFVVCVYFLYTVNKILNLKINHKSLIHERCIPVVYKIKVFVVKLTPLSLQIRKLIYDQIA